MTIQISKKNRNILTRKFIDNFAFLMVIRFSLDFFCSSSINNRWYVVVGSNIYYEGIILLTTKLQYFGKNVLFSIDGSV